MTRSGYALRALDDSKTEPDSVSPWPSLYCRARSLIGVTDSQSPALFFARTRPHKIIPKKLKTGSRTRLANRSASATPTARHHFDNMRCHSESICRNQNDPRARVVTSICNVRYRKTLAVVFRTAPRLRFIDSRDAAVSIGTQDGFASEHVLTVEPMRTMKEPLGATPEKETF